MSDTLKTNDEISPSANYRRGNAETNCGGCVYFYEGECEVFNAKVEATGVCDSYQPHNALEGDGDQGNGVGMAQIDELYFADGKVDSDENLIWKTVLRTGTWRYRPGAGQKPVHRPLHVIAGNSSNPQSVIGMSDLVRSFEDGAIEHVTIPLSHQDKVDENTGFIRKLKVEEDPNREGHHILRAGFDFTEKDVESKVKNGSIANTSVGLFYDYVRKEDGKRFPIALAHIALTNHPWINGMQPFGIEASESVEVNSLEFSEDEEVKIENATLVGKINGITYQMPFTYVQSGESTNFSIASSQYWQKQEAAEKQHVSEEEVPRNPKKEGKMPKNLEELEGLGLAEDVVEKVAQLLQKEKDQVQAREDELTQLREEKTTLSQERHKRVVEDRIDELKQLGLSDHPGFLKVVRQVLLSDTGETSLTLSEDGKDKTVTFSDVVNDLIDALPKKEGKINFGEQIESVSTDVKPPENTDGENKSAEDRLKEAEEFLYGTTSK